MKRPAILERLHGVQRAGDGWLAFCPGHDDRNKRSLSVGLGRDGRTLLNCHAAGCPPEQIARAVNMSMADLGPTSGNGHARTTTRPTLAAFASKKHLDLALLIEAGWTDTRRGIAIPYRQRDGSVWRIRYRTSLEPGQGFLWDSQKNKPPIPYGRWLLDDAHDRGELWIVEGESDFMTARTHHLPCLALPGNLAAKVLALEDLVGIGLLWIAQEPGQSGRGFLDALRTRLRALKYTGKALVVRFAEKDLSDAHVAHGDALAAQIRKVQAAARDLWAEDPPVAETAAPDVGPTYIEQIETFLAEEDPPSRWIFPDLLPTDVLMLIHGEPRAGKSLVGVELALSAATGTAPFGLPAFRPVAPIPVLYVQEEDPRSLTRPRLRRLVAERCGTVGPPATLHVSVRRGIDLDERDWVARLTADIQRLGIKFLVLDAARRLSAKVDEGPSKVREVIAVLRAFVTETGVTIAIVHHDTKPPQTGTDQRRRSQRASGGDWFAACECPVHVERVNESQSLVYPQDYKFAVDPAPFTFTCALDGPLIRALVGASTTRESADTAGERGRLVAWLETHGPASKTAMKNAGFGWEALGRLIPALERAGLIDSIPGRTKKSVLFFVVKPPVSEAQDDSSRRAHDAS